MTTDTISFEELSATAETTKARALEALKAKFETVEIRCEVVQRDTTPLLVRFNVLANTADQALAAGRIVQDEINQEPRLKNRVSFAAQAPKYA